MYWYILYLCIFVFATVYTTSTKMFFSHPAKYVNLKFESLYLCICVFAALHIDSIKSSFSLSIHPDWVLFPQRSNKEILLAMRKTFFATHCSDIKFPHLVPRPWKDQQHHIITRVELWLRVDFYTFFYTFPDYRWWHM